MSQFWKLLLLSVAISVSFAVADALIGRAVPDVSFVDGLVMAFLILWCDQVDEKKKTSRGEAQ